MLNTILTLLLLFGHCVQPTVCQASSFEKLKKTHSRERAKYGDRSSKVNNNIRRKSFLSQKRIANNRSTATVKSYRTRIGSLQKTLKNSELTDQEKKSLRVFVNQERMHLKQKLNGMKHLNKESSRNAHDHKRRLKSRKHKKSSLFKPKLHSKQVTMARNNTSPKKVCVSKPEDPRNNTPSVLQQGHRIPEAKSTRVDTNHTSEAPYSVATVCYQVEEV
tara:strand:+ start:728 stop:1384 length:657 start_codon:yes stop_codon:yes gene_type:complete